MRGESLLKKDFRASDINRARNLIQGKYDAGTKLQVGYDVLHQDHKEGEVWEEGGKTYTIEDGIKVSVSRLQKAREYLKVPLLCPKCGKRMSNSLDRKMYPIHGVCFDCVTKMEDDLKRAGLYADYEKHMMLGNIAGFVKDFEARIADLEKNLHTTFVTEDGDLEDWGNISNGTIRHLREWANILSEKLN